jgi:hypothetical protein
MNFQLPPDFIPQVTIGAVNGQLAILRHGNVAHPQAIYLLRAAEHTMLTEMFAPQPQSNIVAASAAALQGLK